MSDKPKADLSKQKKIKKNTKNISESQPKKTKKDQKKKVLIEKKTKKQIEEDQKKKLLIEKKTRKPIEVQKEEDEDNEEHQETEKIGNYNVYITEKLAKIEEIKEKVKLKVHFDRKLITKAVKILLDYNEKTKNPKNILDTNEGFIYVEINFNKLPERYSIRPIQMLNLFIFSINF